jgi:hypothetical protein
MDAVGDPRWALGDRNNWQRHTWRQRKSGQRSERAAHWTVGVMVPAFAPGMVSGIAVSDQMCEEVAAICTVILMVLAFRGVTRADQRGKVEGKVHRHQRVQRQRKDPEPNGTNFESWVSQRHQ